MKNTIAIVSSPRSGSSSSAAVRAARRCCPSLTIKRADMGTWSTPMSGFVSSSVSKRTTPSIDAVMAEKTYSSRLSKMYRVISGIRSWLSVLCARASTGRSLSSFENKRGSKRRGHCEM